MSTPSQTPIDAESQSRAHHLLSQPDLDPAGQHRQNRAAARMVRRLSNRHGCLGHGCADARHEADVRAARDVLEALDLPTPPRLTA